MVAGRDSLDHVRFCPLQSTLGQTLCAEHGAPVDLSTAVLIDGDGGVHTESAAVLKLFPHMGFPYSAIGPVGLAVPAFIRDAAYRVFARSRGDIWMMVKRITGWGDTSMEGCRGSVIGIEGQTLPKSWGFGDDLPKP